MNDVDLNLLPALDALLTEGSVTGAARRLGLSVSAMSRNLARLRSMTGDPLLVRASLPSAVALAEGLAIFELPVITPEIVISAMWHPRLDAEPAHRWLRETFMAVCRDALGA